MKTVNITKKGQISIPKEARELAGFKEGDKVVIISKKSGIEIRSLKDAENQICLDPKNAVEELSKVSMQSFAKWWDTPEEDASWAHLQEEK